MAVGTPNHRAGTEGDADVAIPLIERARSGDTQAFDEVFPMFERHVFAQALRALGDYEDARDLVQDVFIHARDKIGQLRDARAFAGWLRSTTKRMAINSRVRDTYRKKVMHVAALGDGGEEYLKEMADFVTPQDVIIEEEEHQSYLSSMQSMKPMDRRTLELFYGDECSLKEMQAILSGEEGGEVPIGTIKRRLHVARKRLKKAING